MTGEIDMATVRVLTAAMDPHLHGMGPGDILAVDLSGVTFIDLHGITLLETATETARSHAATFRVLGCSPRLWRLLLLTGTSAALDLA